MTVQITRAAEAVITIVLDGLGIGAAVDSSTITPAAGDLEHQVRVTLANIAESGDKVAGVYLLASNDGVTFTTAEADANPIRLGTLDLENSTADITGHFPVAAKFGGFLPTYYRIRVKNQAGAAFAGSGNDAGFVAVGQTTV